MIVPSPASKRVACAWLLLRVLSLQASPVDDAAALIRTKQFVQAQALLAPIVRAEPDNAAACYYLGMARRENADAAGLAEAITWLKKAAELVPNNADYLADYGGTCLMLAEKDRSPFVAIRGRDALEKALQLDPGDTDSRQVLFEFYMEAPWPLGSSTKATAQLEQIRAHNPARAAALQVRLKTAARNFDDAFQACDALLARNPNDYTALYEYGWCAAQSGRNLDHGIACLQRALTLPPPSPASPTPTKLWSLIATLQLKAKRPAEAKAACATALKLDPNNTDAANQMAKLK
jgi:tetratricopeptide (TPR) repeat protein